MRYLEGSEGELLVVLHAGHFALARAQARQPLQHLLRLRLHLPHGPVSRPACLLRQPGWRCARVC